MVLGAAFVLLLLMYICFLLLFLLLLLLVWVFCLLQNAAVELLHERCAAAAPRISLFAAGPICYSFDAWGAAVCDLHANFVACAAAFNRNRHFILA